MEQKEKKDWLRRLDVRKSEEIERMFKLYSNYIDPEDLQQTFIIDPDLCCLVELLTRKRNRERKKTKI